MGGFFSAPRPTAASPNTKVIPKLIGMTFCFFCVRVSEGWNFCVPVRAGARPRLSFYIPVAAPPLLASFFRPEFWNYSAASRCFLMMPRISAAAVGMLVPGP